MDGYGALPAADAKADAGPAAGAGGGAHHNTPVLLSQASGMKKEAVSRCLKALYEKDCISKRRNEADERSYQLFITDTGLEELKKGYESILQPFYDLWRASPGEFEAFMHCAERLAAHIEEEKENP